MAGTLTPLTLGEDLILLPCSSGSPRTSLLSPHFAVSSPNHRHPLQPPLSLEKNHTARGNISVIFLSPQYLPRSRPRCIHTLPRELTAWAPCKPTPSKDSFQGPARCLWTSESVAIHLCTPEGWTIPPPWGTTSWPLPYPPPGCLLEFSILLHQQPQGRDHYIQISHHSHRSGFQKPPPNAD